MIIKTINYVYNSLDFIILEVFKIAMYWNRRL